MPNPSNRLDAGERVFFDTQLIAIDKQAELINAAYELAKEHSKDFIVRFITIAAM